MYIAMAIIRLVQSNVCKQDMPSMLEGDWRMIQPIQKSGMARRKECRSQRCAQIVWRKNNCDCILRSRKLSSLTIYLTNSNSFLMEYQQPICPKCGRRNVRTRKTNPDKPCVCVYCGHEGTEAEFTPTAGSKA